MDGKKFWEREGFDIRIFVAVFSGVYRVYYDSGNYGREYQAMVERGDQLLKDSEALPLLTMFAVYRKDIVTSDRESAALAVTYGIYENWNKNENK